MSDAARLFEYDRSAPLDVREASKSASNGVTVHDITYASPKGGRVPAYLVVPDGRGPFAGIVLQHGAPGSRERMVDGAKAYARSGAVVIAISAPFARDNRPPQEMLALGQRDFDEQVQLIVDLRRAVDLLAARPDVDAKRIAYVGGSYGGAMGGLLAGVERRIKAYVLMVGDGGLVAHFKAMGDRNPLNGVPAEERDRWYALMDPIEPIHFVGKAAPSAVLMQSGRQDDLVPAASAEEYHKAAGPKAVVKWYDAGHRLNAEARADRLAWLAEQIGIDPAKFGGEGLEPGRP